MSDQRLLLEYLSNRRAGEEIIFSEIRSVLEWSDDAIVGMMEDMGLGSWFSHHKTRMSVKDHSILEALCGSLDEKEDRPSGKLQMRKDLTCTTLPTVRFCDCS